MFKNRMTGPRGWTALVIPTVTMLVVAAACGSTAGWPGPSPSTQPVPTASSPPTFQALVGGTAKGPDAPIRLYDSATGQGRAISVDGGLIRFAGQGRVSYVGSGGLYSQNFDGTAQRTEVSGAVYEYGWGPDGSLAYVTSTASGAPDDRGQLVIRPAGGRTPATVDLGAGVGAVGIRQEAVQFSPDGRLVMVAQRLFGLHQFSVYRLDGTVPFDLQGNHGAWAPDGRLYFSSSTGILVVDPTTGATTTVVSGAGWYNPSVSPDGRYVVFEQRDRAADQPGGLGPPRLQVLDTRTGTIVSDFRRDGALMARFVTPSRFWFYEMGSIVPAQTQPILGYDLTTQRESQTGLTGMLWDISLGSAK